MKRSKNVLIMGMAMGLLLNDQRPIVLDQKPKMPLPEDLEKLKYFKARSIAKRNGLKEFDIDGIKVFALNKKNAERKAKKLI